MAPTLAPPKDVVLFDGLDPKRGHKQRCARRGDLCVVLFEGACVAAACSVSSFITAGPRRVRLVRSA